MFRPRKEVAEIRAKYTPGTRIVLNQDIDDIQPIKAGEKGTVRGVDDIGQILMSWDNAGSLALNVDEDDFSVIENG